MTDLYRLDGKKVVPCEDVREWGYWFENADRKVARDTIEGVWISTVFLGVDHSFGEGPPTLFETMVFGGPLDEEVDRCSTWEEAEEMHKRMVERVKACSAP